MYTNSCLHRPHVHPSIHPFCFLSSYPIFFSDLLWVFHICSRKNISLMHNNTSDSNSELQDFTDPCLSDTCLFSSLSRLLVLKQTSETEVMASRSMSYQSQNDHVGTNTSSNNFATGTVTFFTCPCILNSSTKPMLTKHLTMQFVLFSCKISVYRMFATSTFVGISLIMLAD